MVEVVVVVTLEILGHKGALVLPVKLVIQEILELLVTLEILATLVILVQQDRAFLLEVHKVKYWSRQLEMTMLLSGLLLVVEVVVLGRKVILAQQGQMLYGISAVNIIMVSHIVWVILLHMLAQRGIIIHIQ